jgi:hypothetical protein
MLSRPSHRHVCSLTLVPRPHCLVLTGGRLRNVSSRPALAHTPRQGGLTTGRLTGRDEGDRSCDPRADGRAGRATASAFTNCGHALSWVLGSNGPPTADSCIATIGGLFEMEMF